MDYKSYKRILEAGYTNIIKENVLFWNLWNATYPFEILERYKENYEEEYALLQEMWSCCWEINDRGQIQIKQFRSVFEKSYPFPIDEDTGEIIDSKSILQRNYDEYSDDILPELCISLLIGRFGEIYDGVINGAQYGRQSHSASTSIIDLILASNDLRSVFDEMDLPIVNNEISAQTQLIALLDRKQNFSFKDRNIFRNRAAMDSLQYKVAEEE